MSAHLFAPISTKLNERRARYRCIHLQAEQTRWWRWWSLNHQTKPSGSAHATKKHRNRVVPPRRLSITLFLRATQTANEGHADPSFWTLNVFPLRCGKVTIFGHWIWAETRERKLEEQFIRHELFLFFSIEIWRTKTEPYGRRDCIEYTQT